MQTSKFSYSYVHDISYKIYSADYLSAFWEVGCNIILLRLHIYIYICILYQTENYIWHIIM